MPSELVNNNIFLPNKASYLGLNPSTLRGDEVQSGVADILGPEITVGLA